MSNDGGSDQDRSIELVKSGQILDIYLKIRYLTLKIKSSEFEGDSDVWCEE